MVTTQCIYSNKDKAGPVTGVMDSMKSIHYTSLATLGWGLVFKMQCFTPALTSLCSVRALCSELNVNFSHKGDNLKVMYNIKQAVLYHQPHVQNSMFFFLIYKHFFSFWITQIIHPNNPPNFTFNFNLKLIITPSWFPINVWEIFAKVTLRKVMHSNFKIGPISIWN